MSRIGMRPIQIPDGVSVDVVDQLVTVKGKLGQQSAILSDVVNIDLQDKLITLTLHGKSPQASKMWGLSRSLLSNLILGVNDGFTRKLEIQGVGYRAQLQGKELVLQLGFSHEVRYLIPENIKIECSDQTHISVFGSDKQKVGQTAAEIRSFRKPEPYKGKGIRYEGEYVYRKEGKKK
jgi:large subunit ribosomal protein L6